MTLVWDHSKEGYECPLYEFQPFDAAIQESSVACNYSTSCVIKLHSCCCLNLLFLACQNLTLAVPLEMRAFEQIP